MNLNETSLVKEELEMIDRICSMPATKIIAFQKELMMRFGLTEDMLAVGGGGGAAQASEASAEQEGPKSVKLFLKNSGLSKMSVIKFLKDSLGFKLADAKQKTDDTASGPVELKADMKREDAQKLADELKALGAETEIK